MPPTVEDRLRKLERTNRWLTFALFSTVVLVATAATMGASRRWITALEAQRFILVDECGVRRAELAMENGEPGLRMYSRDGRERRLDLNLKNESSHFQMWGKGGFGLVSMTAAPTQASLEVGANHRVTIRDNVNGPTLTLRESGQAAIEIGKIGNHWTLRAFNAAGASTEFHKVAIR